ncbi:MAG: hypothetical protein CO108_09720 [Deltaproteobacteria bacterium CG_4_9_14_3_um_filter_63_12]|nr:MAG: hypothetical protein CO108_09720 [Deltaproteobacteria bacterium CG_4_9_14_3_um_filter_63_12]
MHHLVILVALWGPPVGFWPNPNGVLAELRCPTSGEYDRVTKVPSGCVVERPCACYDVEEHVRTVSGVASLRAERDQLRLVVRDCAAKSLDQAGKVALADAEATRLQDQLDRLANVPDPPSRLVWTAVGAGGASIVIGALLLAVALQ